MPETPPETTLGVLPFTIQGPLAAFLITKDNNYTLNYPGVTNALISSVGSSTYSIRVTHVGIYGDTSVAPTADKTGVQYIINLSDAYSGRYVRGVSDLTRRARAGLQMSHLRQWKWYDQGNRDVISEKDIAYVRYSASNACPTDDALANLDIVVRGFVRFTRNVGSC